MTTAPRTVRADEPLTAALELMIEGGHRQVPVLSEQGRPAGLVASRDLLEFIADRIPEAVMNLPPHLHQVMTSPEGG